MSLINKIKGPTEREAINKQLELERERMRAEFSKGLDFANNDLKGLDDMMKNKENQGGCAKCLSSLSRFWT